MAEPIPGLAALLPPDISLLVIAFGWTATSTVLGEERVTEPVRTAHRERVVTNPPFGLTVCSVRFWLSEVPRACSVRVGGYGPVIYGRMRLTVAG